MPPIPVYADKDVVLARVARQLGMTASQLANDAPQWIGICEDGINQANHFVHQQLVGRLGSSAGLQQEPGVRLWAGRVAVCFSLREAMLSGSYKSDMLEMYCKCLEEGELYIPLTPTGEPDPGARVCTTGPMDTTGDTFTRDMPT
jgi:hypothetical protein